MTNEHTEYPAIRCPWPVVKDLCECVDPVFVSNISTDFAWLVEANANTIALNFGIRTIRIERYLINSMDASEKLIAHFDTILGACSKGKAPAELILKMLGTSYANQ